MSLSIRHSFAAKLNLYILSSLTIIFFIGMGFFYRISAHYIEKQIYQNISRQADDINLRVSHLMRMVEKIPENVSWLLPAYVTVPDSIFNITRQVVKNNDEIFGCAIAFEPYYFPSKGKYFAPYSYMKGDSVITIQIDSNYNYYQRNWYKLAKENNISRWTRPYHELSSHEVITSTYSVPLRVHNKIIGIFSVDLSLNWLTEVIDSIKPYPDSYIFIINRNGRYILHNRHNIFQHQEENIFDIASSSDDSSVIHIARKIANGETGKATFFDHHDKSYIFYSPITGTEWCLATICPYTSLYEGLNTFNLIIFIVFMIFLCLVYILITTTVHKITHPLKNLTISASSIAEGNFNTRLPVIHSQDEMKDLYDAFNEMQNKLSRYLNNLETTIAAKEKIESELRIAHDIQMNMLPKSFPAFPEREEIDLYAVIFPARQVGGDLYDYFILNNKLYFAIGDVSGKGIPASLLMASTISLLRTFSSHYSSPAQITCSLNNSIQERNENGMFVTFFIGMLDLDTGRLRYCNAGHTPPILTHPDRTVSVFDIRPDLPLGILKDHIYQEYTYQFVAGSGILLYTDGVTDAENPAHEFYTKERLLRAVRKNHESHPREFIENILIDIQNHRKSQELTDDLSMLTIIYGTEWNIRKR